MHALVFNEFHPGPAEDGFRWCVKSVRANSPGTNVIRIGGDRVDRGICDFVHMDLFKDKLAKFKSIYSHISELPVEFEYRGIARWIYFYNYCIENGIKEFFTMDSDVLIFCNLKDECARWGDAPFSIMDPNSHSLLTVGVAFFRNLDPLADFVDWLHWVYAHRESDEWKTMLASTNNLTDMWLWTYFIQFHQGNRKHVWNDLCTPRDGRVWDANMQLIKDWDNDGESKKIEFIDNVPRGTLNGSPVILNCLHCWGIWKTRMRELWLKSRGEW